MPIRKRERRELAWQGWSAPETKLPELWSALGISDDAQRQHNALQSLTSFAETYLQRQQQSEKMPSAARQRGQLERVARRAEKLGVALVELLERHPDAHHAFHLQNPWQSKDGKQTLADFMIDLASLQHAATESQVSLADRTGPRSHPNLHLLVIELCQLYEEMTRRPATHNPKILTQYDGNPHSAAGKFVQAAVELIDPPVRITEISTALAYAIAELKRQKGQR